MHCFRSSCLNIKLLTLFNHYKIIENRLSEIKTNSKNAYFNELLATIGKQCLYLSHVVCICSPVYKSVCICSGVTTSHHITNTGTGSDDTERPQSHSCGQQDQQPARPVTTAEPPYDPKGPPGQLAGRKGHAVGVSPKAVTGRALAGQ